MRKYGKWLLVLGVLAAHPAAASADGFLTGKIKTPFRSSAQERNQAQADAVAAALQSANVSGSDIEIEVRDGVAILDGRVSDPGTRAVAQRMAASVPGIQRVENNLTLLAPTAQIEQASAREADSRVTQAAAFEAPGATRSVQQVNAEWPAAGGRSNQEVAQDIAASLSSAGLTGYDVEIRFNNGTATLAGEVSTLAQRQAATAAVQQIAGVQSVNNQLRVSGPVAQTGYHPAAMPMAPAGYGPMMQPGMAMDPSMMPSPMGYAPTSFNHPQLPGHAWPSYAQYPNSAAVSYPTQYSASAWPYIGPFYPYPQVPLGWREVSLEWDDGYWQLNFNKEKDKWYWVLNPHNW